MLSTLVPLLPSLLLLLLLLLPLLLLPLLTLVLMNSIITFTTKSPVVPIAAVLSKAILILQLISMLSFIIFCPIMSFHYPNHSASVVPLSMLRAHLLLLLPPMPLSAYRRPPLVLVSVQEFFLGYLLSPLILLIRTNPLSTVAAFLPIVLPHNPTLGRLRNPMVCNVRLLILSVLHPWNQTAQ
uniref:Uncharacterized protein n=1 Tax=Anopheles darlingi TaxID=43151 RepID=A0A2M4D0W9_ANODA